MCNQRKRRIVCSSIERFAYPSLDNIFWLKIYFTTRYLKGTVRKLCNMRKKIGEGDEKILRESEGGNGTSSADITYERFPFPFAFSDGGGQWNFLLIFHSLLNLKHFRFSSHYKKDPYVVKFIWQISFCLFPS